MNASAARVAFVVVGWNNRDLLEDCIASILAQTYPDVRAIYVDNGSDDDSVEFVRERFPTVSVVELGYNSGFAVGNNVGVRAALQDKTVGNVALLNTDARLASDWTERLTSFAAMKPRGACFQGTTLKHTDHAVVDSTHVFVCQSGFGFQAGWQQYYRYETGPLRVFGVNAAACMISRAFVDQQPFRDLFDPAFFMYVEDVDLAVRATMLGWDNYLVAGARAYHIGSSSAAKLPGFGVYMSYRNTPAILYKNYPLRQLIAIVPRMLAADVSAISYLLSRRDRALPLKIIRGRLVGLLRLPLYWRARQTMNAHRRRKSSDVWLLMRRGW